ncbi:MAG: hypothetical protein K5665_10675 [Saccharofermentans sp.]|nr:hypothetical protein [Saccharofermentans sp.]
MKKIVALFISVFVLLTCFMCGCKKNDGSNGNGYDKGREEETEEAETKETAGTENSGNAEGNVPDRSGVEDPTQETSVTMGPSGHIFENGKCTDCDMLWTEYVYDAMTEDEIKELFDEYGVTYLSKDEFIDLVWEDHDNYFGSIDSGLEKINTSLADDGFNWK